MLIPCHCCHQLNERKENALSMVNGIVAVGIEELPEFVPRSKGRKVCFDICKFKRSFRQESLVL